MRGRKTAVAGAELEHRWSVSARPLSYGVLVEVGLGPLHLSTIGDWNCCNTSASSIWKDSQMTLGSSWLELTKCLAIGLTNGFRN